MMELKDKKVLVVGLARSGVAAARFLAGREARVTATDVKPEAELQAALQETAGLPVTLRLGGHREEDFLAADLVVISPGVPLEIPELRRVRERGIEVIAEIELAYRALRERGSRAEIVAVTGANGKTTVTTLLGELAARAGRQVFVGGNIGRPLLLALEPGEDYDCLVVEVSSFQLEAITSFRPRIGVLLNITEDHLDRYDSFRDYARAKARIFAFQTPADFLIANREDPVTLEVIREAPSRILQFSYRREVEAGAFLREGRNGGEELVFRGEGGEETLPLPALTVPGVHFRENVLAAFTAGRLLGFSGDKMLGQMAEFRGLPHRTELFATWKGIRFVDDSKATNVGAVERALQGFPPGSVILIAGGKDKGGDYRVISDLVREKVALLLLIGEAADKIQAAWGGLVPTRRAETLPRAVEAAVEAARPGQVVLLSPACSSFDQFQNYEERGRVFRREVEQRTHG